MTQILGVIFRRIVIIAQEFYNCCVHSTKEPILCEYYNYYTTNCNTAPICNGFSGGSGSGSPSGIEGQSPAAGFGDEEAERL